MLEQDCIFITRTDQTAQICLPTMLFFTRYFIVSRTPLEIMLEVNPKNIVQLSIGRWPGSRTSLFTNPSSDSGRGSVFFLI